MTRKQKRLVEKHVKSLAGIQRLIHELDLTFKDYFIHVNALKKGIYFIEQALDTVIIKNKAELHGYTGKGFLPVVNTRKYIKIE